MTLVVPYVDIIYIYVLLISELAKIGAMKPIFLDSGSPRGGGRLMRAWAQAPGLLSLYSSYTKFK